MAATSQFGTLESQVFAVVTKFVTTASGCTASVPTTDASRASGRQSTATLLGPLMGGGVVPTGLLVVGRGE
jgi:hypothetical protein